MAQTSEGYTPHFILEATTDKATIAALQAFEADIHDNPQAVQHSLSLLGTPEIEGNPYAERLTLATSTEAALDFDDVTEDAIVSSAVIKKIQRDRKDNQFNETRARELAAELRRARLGVFISQVIEQKAETAEVIELPEPRHTAVTDSTHDISA